MFFAVSCLTNWLWNFKIKLSSVHGSQPKLSSVVESSVSRDLFLGFYRQDFDLRQQSQWSLEKTAKLWGRHHWFLRKMTFGNDCRNFILATSCVTTQIWVVLLIAIFPRQTTNQKHYPDLGIGTPSVWNFCSHFSDVISQENQCWCWKMSAVLSGYLTVVQFSWCKVAMQLGVAMWVGTGLNVDPSSCSFPKALFLWRQVVMGRRDISLQNVVNCLREKQKIWPCLKGDPPSQEGEWRHCFTIVILYILKKCNNAGPKYKRRRVTKIYPNLATRTHMYELVTKLGLRRTDNHFYYTLYSLSVARGARGGREEGSLPTRAPRPSRFSRA